MIKSLSFSSLMRGLIFTLIIAAILALLSSTIFYFFTIKNSALLIMSNITLAGAVFGGSFLAARTAGKGGLYHGLVLGCVVFIVILVFTLLWGSVSWSILAQKAGLTVLGGILGGILGVR